MGDMITDPAPVPLRGPAQVAPCRWEFYDGKEAPGKWRMVFDKGQDIWDCRK
jgi:hypothetical protein